MNEAKNVEQSTLATGGSPSRAGGVWWRLPLLVAVVLVASSAARYSRLHERSHTPQDLAARKPADATGKSVSLVIRFDDGRERKFDAIAWHPEMTVDDLMTVASRLPDGINYDVGSDERKKMVVMIDDVYVEWGGGRFWLVQVNDVPIDDRLATHELQPGDRVLWTFERRK